MDNRRYFLLTLLPPLPGPGEPLQLTLAEALGRLREQGGRDLERLAEALEAETTLREALDEWALAAPGSRVAPAGLPPALAALFSEERLTADGEELWVDAVWQAWFELLSAVGRESGVPLLARWAAWEMALRSALALRREVLRGGAPGRDPAPASPAAADEDAPHLEALLAAWDAARRRARPGEDFAAAMEAEELLERARLEFLERAAVPYSFSANELASYLLRLRLLERRRRRDPAKGRELLRRAAAL